MATNAGEIEVSIKADAEQLKTGFDKAKGAVSNFASNAGDAIKSFGQLVAGVGGAIVAFGAKSVQAYGEQEVAVAALNQALANQGRYTEETSKSLQAYASQLQNVTTYGDETIISVQAQLAAFGLEGQKLKEVTKATLDLAAAKGIDLRSAADLLGKAFVGETGTLSRYGIVIGQNIPKSEKFAQALSKVNSMFGGQAEAKAQTFSGQIEQLGNAFSDLQEEIGALIAGNGQGLITLLIDFTKYVGSSIAQIREFSAGFKSFGDFLNANFILVMTAVGSAILEVVGYVVSFLSKIPMISGAMTSLKTQLDATRLGIESQGVAMQAALNTTDYVTSRELSAEQQKQAADARTLAVRKANMAALAQAKAKQEADEIARMERLRLTDQLIQQSITEHQNQALIDRAKAIDEFFGFEHGVWKTFWDAASQLVKQTFDNFGKAMADVLIDSKSFSEALKNIWKDLVKSLISEIVALIAKLIVALAIKSALGLGGASVAQAAANIGSLQKITSKNASGGMINEPSVITGLRSGKQMLAGESGPEAITPWAGANASNAEMGMPPGSGSGGGGSVTINISGEFLEGDESKWQNMFRQKILPEIRRSTMSNPTGNFIRKRGATT